MNLTLKEVEIIVAIFKQKARHLKSAQLYPELCVFM